MSSETAPLVSTDVAPADPGAAELGLPTPQAVSPKNRSFREKTATFLNSKALQWAVIFLTALDGCFTLTDIGYDFVKDPICLCDNSCPPDPQILGVFSSISSCITGLFVAELPITVFAFGSGYYLSDRHRWMHLFDAFVILSTFILEIVLHGREAEIAGLLIILRLWRLMKLVTTVVDLETTAEAAHEETWQEMFDRERAQLHELWLKEKKVLVEELELVREELQSVKGKLMHHLDHGDSKKNV
ncbi:hypothetical protein T439DRAFT_321914 [Meredithblackwellia eburnea MCA 4105]